MENHRAVLGAILSVLRDVQDDLYFDQLDPTTVREVQGAIRVLEQMLPPGPERA